MRFKNLYADSPVRVSNILPYYFLNFDILSIRHVLKHSFTLMPLLPHGKIYPVLEHHNNVSPLPSPFPNFNMLLRIGMSCRILTTPSSNTKLRKVVPSVRTTSQKEARIAPDTRLERQSCWRNPTNFVFAVKSHKNKYTLNNQKASQ